MSSVALILEGHGDIESFPTLISKTGMLFNQQIFAPKPIKAGGYGRLMMPGQLERYIEMAATREDIDFVMVAVDIDDGCPVTAQEALRQRAEKSGLQHGVAVKVCLCVREYEGWFLHCIDVLKSDAANYEWLEIELDRNPDEIRGAKEALNKMMKKSYKESTDQLALTKKLDLSRLYARSRSYRKFCREITGMEYIEMNSILGISD